MKHGYLDAYINKMLFYGSAGVGKTCSRNIVAGDKPPEVRNSTPIATRPVTMYQMKATKGVWCKYTPKDRMKLCAQISKSILGQEIIEALAEVKSKHKQTVSKPDDEVNSTQSLPQITEKQDTDYTPLQHDQSSPEIQASVASPQSPVDPEVIQVIHDVLHKLFELIDECPDTVEPISYLHKVRIVDSGGQPQFHEVLPIFLRKMSMIVFVFKLSEDLSSRPTIEYFEEGSALGTPYKSDLTTKQLFKHGLQSLHSHRCDKKKGGDSPWIVVLGTHKDEEKKSNETREAKNQKLRDMLLPTFESEVVYYQPGTNEVIFPMNAKSPGEEEEAIAQVVRSVISEECQSGKRHLPLQWMALEIILEEITGILKRGLLSKKECLEVAQRLHLDESMLEAALTYLDELSLIFYYPDILPDLVFTDPQVLLDKASEMVKVHHDRVMKCSFVGNTDWQKFFNHALLTVEFLEQELFKKHYVPGLFDPKHLIILFRKLLIFADFSEGKFFVPSLLQMLSNEDVSKRRLSADSLVSPLILHFSDGPPRRGIFCALVSFLTSPENHFPGPWKLKMPARSVTPTCLHRNCIQFTISCVKTPCTVTLIDTLLQFEIHLDITCNEAAGKLCSIIKQAITAGLVKANITLGYTNSTPCFAFPCSCGGVEPHHATIGDGFWICSLDEGEGAKFSPNQLIWLEEVTAIEAQTGMLLST